MLFEKTYEEILEESIGDMTSSTRLNKMSAGAKARSFLEVVSRKLNESYRSMDLNMARAFISGSTGKFLDLWGEWLSRPRLGSAAASVSADVKAIRFYVESGTFGAINGAANIVIPAGTIISSQKDGQGVLYKLIAGATLLAASSSTYVSVEAVSPGTDSNVGQGVLKFHSFTSYTDVVNNTLKVVNDQGIFTGRDLESDTNYRFRLINAVTAAEAGNESAVLLAALSVPGVAEVTLIPYARGIGTFDVMVKSQLPTVSQSLLDAVQSSITAVQALGGGGKARKPVEAGLTFSISIKYRSALTPNDRQDIESRIKTNLTDYVNSLDIGEEFVINEAVQRVLEVDERIRDIGTPGTPFDEIALYKPTKLQDNKIKNILLKNYTPASNERIIIEPSVATPITITTV